MLCTDTQRLRENTYAIIRCTRVYIPIKSNLISTVNSFIAICFLCKFVLEYADCVEKVKKTRFAIIFIVHFLLLPTSPEYIQCNIKYNIHVTYSMRKGNISEEIPNRFALIVLLLFRFKYYYWKNSINFTCVLEQCALWCKTCADFGGTLWVSACVCVSRPLPKSHTQCNFYNNRTDTKNFTLIFDSLLFRPTNLCRPTIKESFKLWTWK